MKRWKRRGSRASVVKRTSGGTPGGMVRSSQDWTSAEDMRRADQLYAWVIEIAHNPAAAPGGGSCIFFHVWGGADHPTAGCTAMAEPALVALLAALDPGAHPVLALLPAGEYAALRSAWGLP